MPKILDNFSLKSKKFLDSRMSFKTKALMNDYDKNSLPSGMLSYCLEDNKYYSFNGTEWKELSLDSLKISADPANKATLKADGLFVGGISETEINKALETYKQEVTTELAKKANSIEVETKLNAKVDTTALETYKQEVTTKLDAKLDANTKFKTINGQDIKGTGNIAISVDNIDMTGYYTKTQTNEELAKKANVTDFENYKIVTDAKIEKKLDKDALETYKANVDAKLLEKLNKADLDTELGNKIDTALDPKINAKLADYTTTADLETKLNAKVDSTALDAYKQEVTTKLDAKLDANTKFKTINGQEIKGDGNIAISVDNIDMTGYYTKTQTNEELAKKANVTDLANKLDSTALDAYKQEVTTKLDAKLDANTKFKTINGQDIKGTGNIAISVDNIDMTGYYTKTQTNEELAKKANVTDLANKLDSTELDTYKGEVTAKLNTKLDANTEFKTVNGQDIKGTGNIAISVDNIDMTGYYTKTQTDAELAKKANVTDLANKLDSTALDTYKQEVTASLGQKLDITTADTTYATKAELNQVNVNISAEANNKLVKKTDGLFVDAVSNTELTTKLADYTTTADLTTKLTAKVDTTALETYKQEVTTSLGNKVEQTDLTTTLEQYVKKDQIGQVGGGITATWAEDTKTFTLKGITLTQI